MIYIHELMCVITAMCESYLMMCSYLLKLRVLHRRYRTLYPPTLGSALGYEDQFVLS